MLYFHKYDAEVYDGICGKGYKKAVMEFQKDKGIGVDGDAGPYSFVKFFS